MIPRSLMEELMSIFTLSSREDQLKLYNDLLDVIEPYWTAMEVMTVLLLEEGMPESAHSIQV